VAECLKVLESQRLLSAPVLDEKTGEILGIVDTQSILLFILGIYPKEINRIEELTSEAFSTIIKTGKRFEQSPISHVIEVDKKFRPEIEHIFPVVKETPIQKLIDMFYLGVHRVPLIGEKGQLLNVISQSDLLRVLAECIPFLGELASKTLKDLKIGTTPNLLKVNEDKIVLQVIAEMQRQKVSAVPLVSKAGQITGTFSASNLKDTGIYNFGEMLVPVREYLTLQNMRTKPFLVSLQSQKSLHPITCKLDASFKHIVNQMVAMRLHRIWVVDDNEKPIGVISLGDLFQVFLPWGKPNLSY
jgi:CBS domain-containing protein